ncbi:TonB-dependent receptor [Shewanella sp. VB17]|nr:TonB-dependent receptor [Shewanella sp. VB17]
MLSLLVAANLVQAQTLSENIEEDELLDLYGDTEMIAIATGNLQTTAKAPAVATVISARDIQISGATDLDELLETVPGLHVSRSALGYNPIYTFRGIQSAYNPQVLVLINGIPISNLFQGDRSLIWGGMPVNAIKRIEVIRGPGSALYGADAFAGVINIVTLSGHDISENEFGVRLGSFDTQDAWAKIGFDWQDFSVGLVLEIHNTDGQDEVIDLDRQSLLDAITGTQVSNAPGSVSLSRENIDARLDITNGHWQLRSGMQLRRDWGNGVGGAESLDPSNRWKSNRYNADLTYRNDELADFWDLQAQMSYLQTSIETDNDLRLFPAGSDLSLLGLGGVYPDGLIGNPESFERHYRGNLTAIYSRLEQHQLRFGLGYTFSDLYKVKESKNFGPDPITGSMLPPGSPVVDVSDSPYVYMNEGDRTNIYAYVQDVWYLADDWELTTGLRFDDYSDFGNSTNPRLALVWSTSQKLTTKALYGQAFRTPSFAETQAINNPVVLGNPDLAPETLASYELAFDYRATTDLKLALNLFYYDWQDIIKFTQDENGSTKTAKNMGHQTGKGIELDMDWAISERWKVNANYAWQESIDESTNNKIALVPESQLYLALDWAITHNISLHNQVNWIMSRAREPYDNRDQIADYAVLDITLHYESTSGGWGADIIMRNVTDSDAREPSVWSIPQASIPNDLPLEGRNMYAQLYVKF